jgi:hypothetical protein
MMNPMTPEERARQAAAIASVGDKQLQPHPHGVIGRALDALDDLELVSSDPNATDAAKRSAATLAAALVAALRAED